MDSYPNDNNEGTRAIRSIKANKGKTLIVSIVLFSALGYFAFIAFQGAMVYYFTVSEITTQSETLNGKTVRVSGKLVQDSFHRSDGSTLAQFSLTDGVEIMEASHDGVLPDLFFNEHSEIILEGIYIRGREFHSQNVIVKCPSKSVAVDNVEKDKS